MNKTNNRTLGSTLSLVSAVMALITLVAYSLIAPQIKIFHISVPVFLCLALVCAVAYVLFQSWVFDIANVLTVVFATLAFGTYLVDSIPTFADVLNGISMFGSTGGLAPVITLLAMMLAVIVLALMSCFMKRSRE